MDLLLTAFGVASSPDLNAESLFYRMPPARVGEVFLPDYEVLLLCDRIVMDTQTFDRLRSDMRNPAYKTVAELATFWREKGSSGSKTSTAHSSAERLWSEPS
jgi:hypothetical protein